MRQINFLKCLVFCFIIINLIVFCNCISLEEELTVTLSQKLALDELKTEAVGKLPHDFMKKEIFLIKWLRATNFDVQKAKRMILNMVEWRMQNKIDSIMSEDFSFYEKKFPFWLDGEDLIGRPVGSADIAIWDPRPVILAGKAEQLLRFGIRVLEKGSRLIRHNQANGKNVTQLTLIANMDGFNLIQHACVQCISFYVRFLMDLEQFYPGLMHKIYLVNTPSAFDVLFRIIRPILSFQTAEALSIHGTNKNEWQQAVYNEIAYDQLRPQFGGTKEMGLEDY